MNYFDVKFVVEWVRDHPQLSNEKAARGAMIALRREKHRETEPVDVYENWMSDTQLALSVDRALAGLEV